MSINLNNLQKLLQITSQQENTKLMAVTKNRSPKDILNLLNRGITIFGENKVQEAIKKFEIIDQSNLELHLIGPLQSNKALVALKYFDVIQTIDRFKLVKEIAKNLNKKDIRTKKFFIQINIGDEPQKSGISLNEFKELYNFSISSGLNIVGIMCIPPAHENPSQYFEKMLDLKKSINSQLLLSMGMSSDYEVAIKFQSNIIRVGSSLFQDD